MFLYTFYKCVPMRPSRTRVPQKAEDESDGGEGGNNEERSISNGGNKMSERILKWLFMSESEEELVKPFTAADMRTKEGMARLIVACALLGVSIAYITFVVLVAIGVI